MNDMYGAIRGFLLQACTGVHLSFNASEGFNGIIMVGFGIFLCLSNFGMRRFRCAMQVGACAESTYREASQVLGASAAQGLKL